MPGERIRACAVIGLQISHFKPLSSPYTPPWPEEKGRLRVGAECAREAEIEQLDSAVEGLEQGSEEQGFPDSEELRKIVLLGREQGYLTFEQIAVTLEEVEVTKEQVSHLHSHLIEHGVDVIAEDGVSAYKEQKAGEPSSGGAKKAELDLTVEPSLDSLRLYLRSIGRVEAAHRAPGDRAGQADRAR